MGADLSRKATFEGMTLLSPPPDPTEGPEGLPPGVEIVEVDDPSAGLEAAGTKRRVLVTNAAQFKGREGYAPNVLDGIRPQRRGQWICAHLGVADLAQLAGWGQKRLLVTAVARFVIVGARPVARVARLALLDQRVLRMRQARLVDRRSRRFDRARRRTADREKQD